MARGDKRDGVIDDLLRAAAVLDAAQQDRPAGQIDILPFEAEQAAPSRAGFEAKLDERPKPWLRAEAQASSSRAISSLCQPHIALVIDGGTRNILGVDRVDNEAEPPLAIVDDALEQGQLAPHRARRDRLAVCQAAATGGGRGSSRNDRA